MRCVYIDPPYNTGNEGWSYNDNVSDPRLQKWLGEVVGKEGEDLSRHDKWLCMMYPRLKLLRQLLSQDGSIWISIDDNEVAHLRLVMDEIFGAGNFVANVIWQKVYAPKNSAMYFSEDHDYVLTYARNKAIWRPNLVQRSEGQDDRYSNPDNDPRGPWKPGDFSARNYYSRGTYSITCPNGRVITAPPKGNYWRFSEERLKDLDADGRIWWGKGGGNVPALKRFLSEVRQGLVPQTLWPYSDVGHTQDAKKELLSIMDFGSSDDVFVTPKPTRLIQRVLQIATDADSIVLDSFAGSGTTAHAVLKQNKDDGGQRRFILVESEDYAENLTAERVRRVISGTTSSGNPGDPLPGGFQTCDLGPAFFGPEGELNPAIDKDTLRRYIWLAETRTGVPVEFSSGSDGLLGVHLDTAYYVLHEPGEGIDLDFSYLRTLGVRHERIVVYASSCSLDLKFLQEHSIVFKKIPRDIPRL